MKRTLNGATTYYIYDGEWSQRGRRDIDGQVREGSRRDERERMSNDLVLEYRSTSNILTCLPVQVERLLRFKALRSNGGECDRVSGALFAGAEQGSPAKPTLVYEDVIPRFTPCSAVSYSLSISGFGNGEEISTCVILLSGSRLASSSTSCLGSVRVLRNKILVILPFTLILLRL